MLADTNALLWLDFRDDRLGAEARRLAEGAWARGALAAATITFWEVSTLVRKGRIELDQDVAAWRAELLALGLMEATLDGAIAVEAGRMADFHGDPADRIIVATALATGMPLMTSDQKILDWPGPLARIDARR